jgi:16S rRNA (cytosine967-C5)-methyltransferase
MDVSPSRLQSVEDNAQRLGLSIKTVVGDGRDLTAPAISDNFDLVLLDVPCSATGVMRRNPDVKLIRLKTDIPQFAALQTELLQSAWHKVRPGGKLLYVTCSLMPAENEDLVSDFVDITNDAQVIPLPETIGIEKKGGSTNLTVCVRRRRALLLHAGKSGLIWSSRKIGVPFAGNDTDHSLFKEPLTS